mgnify:CR=1 FL=1
MTAIANAFFAAPVCRSSDVAMSAPRGKEFLIAGRSYPRDTARPGASRRIIAVSDETSPSTGISRSTLRGPVPRLLPMATGSPSALQATPAIET